MYVQVIGTAACVVASGTFFSSTVRPLGVTPSAAVSTLPSATHCTSLNVQLVGSAPSVMVTVSTPARKSLGP